MKKSLMFAALAIGVFLTGCKDIVEEGEMKGVLEVDKAAFGNAFLEVNDVESRQTRFIHPGRKIVQIGAKGINKVEFVLMDSRRVQLARIVIPRSAYTPKGDTFFIPAKALSQNWDLQGERKQVILRKEYYPTSWSEPCVVKNCQGDNCKGLSGILFEVIDFRSDYELKFVPEGTKLVWGKFVATGSLQTSADKVRAETCMPQSTVYQTTPELF